MRGILLIREDHIAFLQKEAIHKHIYPKATKSIAIHLMSITSKIMTSYLAYHGDQSIWEKHISTAYDKNAVYDTKMQACKHDTIRRWRCNIHMYIILPNRSLERKNNSKLSSQTCKCSLVRISASCFSVGTWMRSMFPYSTLSFRKWYPLTLLTSSTRNGYKIHLYRRHQKCKGIS
jgi:hypothetical protein